MHRPLIEWRNCFVCKARVVDWMNSNYADRDLLVKNGVADGFDYGDCADCNLSLVHWMKIEEAIRTLRESVQLCWKPTDSRRC